MIILTASVRRRVDWLPPTVSNRAAPVNSRVPSPRWLDGNEVVESAGTAPAASILQGSIAPLCTPRDGVQSQCRPDLLGVSNRCFHWISFLDRELRDVRSLARWREPSESNRYQCAGSAWHSQYTRSANFDGYLANPVAMANLPGDGG